ncbi:GT-D fold domain-containing protein [Glutamicibacter bergerei]
MSTVNFIRLDNVESLIMAKWKAKQPFSLVRVGDGELSVLEYPKIEQSRIQHVFRRAMADRSYSDDEITAVRRGLIQSINSADLVGMYDSYESNDLCVVYEDTLVAAGLEWFTGCHPAVHLFMQSTGILDRLLRKAQRVTLVTGRNVIENFQETYPHITVNQHLIPVERQYTVDGDIGGQHYPEVFTKLKSALRPDGPCHLYLIGAGLLGKEYCSVVKSRGGFAIDIGSVFDYWADVPTREGKRAIVDGKAALSGESRWPAIFLGSTPQPDGLSRTAHRGMLRPMEITIRP